MKTKGVESGTASEFAQRLYMLRTAADTIISETDKLREQNEQKKNIHTGDDQDIHKLHTHPRLECTYGLGNTHVIIDYTEYVKAKEREHIEDKKNQPPFVATPEDHHKHKAKLHEYVKRELKHYKDKYYQQIETIREYQEEAKMKTAVITLEKHATTVDFYQVKLKNYQAEVRRLAELMNKQACELAGNDTMIKTLKTKSGDLEKLLYNLETERDFYQSVTKGYKKRLAGLSMTIESLKTTMRDGMSHFKETYYKARIKDLEAQVEDKELDQGEPLLASQAVVALYAYRGRCPKCKRNTVMNDPTLVDSECVDCRNKAKTDDLKKLLQTTETQRNYYQERGEGYKKHIKVMSSTIESLKATVRETKGTTMTNEKAEAFEKEYCGGEEIRPLHADTRSDTFQFANFCPECNRITFTTKAFSEGQICSNCYAKCETPEVEDDDVMTDDEVHKIVWSGCNSYGVSRVNYNKIKEAIEVARAGLEEHGKYRFWPILTCTEPELPNPNACYNKVDEVNQPSHYCNHPSGVECIIITEHMTFNAGNAIKYIWRAGLKQDASKDITATMKHTQDLEKAEYYVKREIKRIKESNNNYISGSGLSWEKKEA